MKKFIPILLIVCLCGCAGYRISHFNGYVFGNNLTTPYGPATINGVYDSTTCLGFGCPKTNMDENI